MTQLSREQVLERWRHISLPWWNLRSGLLRSQTILKSDMLEFGSIKFRSADSGVGGQRNNPIHESSSGVVKIDGRGNLAIFNGNASNSVWSTNISIKVLEKTSSALSYKLLDSKPGFSSRKQE
ncbi:hypothetical protein Syun_027112 [Stephania yunnanensis]|uniref:Bulb-type lectin domain-containing protein n=1 Tax=Stephania yunnanensis TaxID=152371 RepID=A0AAP0EF31_9MAGN